MLERSGADSRMFGLTGQQTAALAGTLLALKVPAEVAGSGINAMLRMLGTATSQGDKFQSALGKIGLSGRALERAIGQDAQGALTMFLEKVAAAPKPMKVLLDLFGMEYADDVARLVGGLDGYKAALGRVSDASSYAGAMEVEYRTKSAETANNIQRMTNITRELAITLGTVLLPKVNELLAALTPMVEAAITWAQANPELVSTLGQLAAAMLGLRIGLIAVQLLFGGVLGTALRVVRVVGLVTGGLGRLAAAGPVLGAALVRLASVAGAVWGIILKTGFLLMSNPIVLVAAAIAGAAYLIWQNWEPIAAFFEDLWGRITAAFETARAGGASIPEALGAAAVEAWLVAWRGIGQVFDWAFGHIAEAFEAVRPTIDRVSTALGGPTVAQIVDAWRPLEAFFVALWSTVRSAFETAWNAIRPIIDRLQSGIATVLEALPRLPSLPTWLGGPAVAGARAGGGPVRRGLTYLVGEQGPELFTAARDGTILPSGSFDRRPPLAVPGGLRTAGPASISVGDVHIHAAPGMDPRAVADEVIRVLRERTRGAADLHEGAHYGGGPW